MDTIPALVACASPDGSVEFVNQAWREYMGSSLERLQMVHLFVADGVLDLPRPRLGGTGV